MLNCKEFGDFDKNIDELFGEKTCDIMMEVLYSSKVTVGNTVVTLLYIEIETPTQAELQRCRSMCFWNCYLTLYRD